MRDLYRCLAALMALLLVFSAGLAEPAALRVEAEDGVLEGNTQVKQSGSTLWVEGFQKPETDRVRIPVETEEGFYDVSVLLASAGGHKENPVLLDGVGIGQIVTDKTRFGRSTLQHIYFGAGSHELTIGTSWGWIKVDAVELTPSEPLPEDLYEVPRTLSVPNPSPEAQRLFDWLCDCYGKKVISGQYCDGGMLGLENQAIWRTTGVYPALLGLDMMDYSPSRVAMGGERDHTVPEAIKYWEKGGIVTFCWHWNAPEPYLKDPWYSGFYTQYTTLDLAKIMDGRDEEGYRLLMRDIDAVAAQLTRLKDAGVPVLWRPLHEASGGWFWWGASGARAYLKLYHLLYDRLTNEYGLNNLIWVWNGQDAAWYPGDDEVDIIGIDIYPGERVYDSQSSSFLECMRVTPARKMIILSENGCVPDPELLFRDGTVWGSWCTWGGEFVLRNNKLNRPSERYTETEMLKKFYADERVITRKDIPDLRGTGEEAATGE
ncbi:MAG: beta-mannosidase [Clostridia bacterium]|nr:beta-mannosidase [Clostridia bacterium]